MSLTVPVLRVPRTLPVLMCHSVPATGGPSGDLQVPLGELREQLRVLRDDGYTVTGLTEALDLGLREPGPRVVALTFDDGYADFLAVAELLADLGCGATLYVPTAHVGGQGMVRDAVVARYGVPCEGRGRYDQADATILAAMGLHWLGYPLAVLPDTHRQALDGVQWPLNMPAVAR